MDTAGKGSSMQVQVSAVIVLLFVVASCEIAAEAPVVHATLERVSPSGGSVAVFDSLFPPETLSRLQTYVTEFTRWQLNEKEGECVSSVSSCEKPAVSNMPWTSDLDPDRFSKSHTWKKLTEVLSASAGTSDRTFYPYHVQAEMMHRGDAVSPRVLAPSKYAGEYAFRIFLVPSWQMDDYGDMSFYTATWQNRTQGSEYDIFLTVRPHPGRVVLWDAFIPTLYRPPSMGYFVELLSISIQLTPAREKFEAACQEWKKLDQGNVQLSRAVFPQISAPVGTLDIESHLVRKFVTSDERKILIFDNLFDKDHLERLRASLVHSPNAVLSGFDVDAAEMVDNTRWIKTFDCLEFAESSTWAVMSQVANHVGRGQQTWFPYDVSLNVVRSADHTRVHEDCEEWEDEYTMVVYLNPDMGIADYGETIFFDAKPFDSYSRKLYEGISEQDYDTIGAVTPKYGRLVIFPGIVPHAARPPSPGYGNARYTFAVKVAVNKQTGLIKKINEHLEDIEVEAMRERTAKEEFLLTKFTKAATSCRGGLGMSDEELEAEWKKFIASHEEELANMRRELEMFL
ncbi:uncharacterized protein [Diadema antillarum]|uniref:uncharacterized protein n=1 Tax=Diadema antillarum TaxID=105358 RepID=UPI003A86FA75